jgi:hypothetical protein
MFNKIGEAHKLLLSLGLSRSSCYTLMHTMIPYLAEGMSPAEAKDKAFAELAETSHALSQAIAGMGQSLSGPVTQLGEALSEFAGRAEVKEIVNHRRSKKRR